MLNTKRFGLRKSVMWLLLTVILALGLGSAVIEIIDATYTDEVTGMKIWFDRPPAWGQLFSLFNGGVKGGKLSYEDNLWQQLTLPVGGGSIGASVYGYVEEDRLTINEKTLWTGGPSDKRPDYNGGNLTGKLKNGKTAEETYNEIVALFLSGEDKKASELCDLLVGEKDIDSYGSYQCWGDIYLKFDHKSKDDYSRSLDLETGIVTVSYKSGGTTYKREYFVSHPDNVFVMRLTAEGKNTLNFDARFESDHGKATANGSKLVLHGRLENNGLIFSSSVSASLEGGTVAPAGDKLEIRGAQAATLCLTAATDYKNDYPAYRTGETEADVQTRVFDTLNAVSGKKYSEIYKKHVEDYQSLYNRVRLDLGGTPTKLPADRALSRYRRGNMNDSEKRYMETLLFNFGRYLMIASSRAGDALPSNLQGIWNNNGKPAWSSDFHMNVNLQMNYWPAYVTDLAECALPLVSYVEALREPGRITAEVYTGVASTETEHNGFIAHTENTPFGWTAPGYEFDWGWSPASVPWILQNVWEYYEYTLDEDFLREAIYPMMKESADYFDRIMVTDPSTGRLLTAPCYSPEHGPRTLGNTYEQSLIWELFKDTAEAADILGIDADSAAKWRANMAKMSPIEIGKSGQIKEWYHEEKLGKIGEKKHRHISHLLGVFPGDLISVETHDWKNAAIVSLNARGDKSTGWAMGQRLNAWARLGEGEKAYDLVESLFKTGLYPNFYDSHPPFQIDGNFGYTSGVAEMLMQSNLGYINILPALPTAWPSGSVSGFIARGNFEVSFSWADCRLKSLTVTSRSGGECILKTASKISRITDSAGQTAAFSDIGGGKVSFATEKGKTYTIAL